MYLWLWYLDISQGRTSGGVGLNPISASEISAWVQLTGNRIKPWEYRIIRALDRTYLTEALKK